MPSDWRSLRTTAQRASTFGALRHRCRARDLVSLALVALTFATLACAAPACAGHNVPYVDPPRPRVNVYLNAPFVGLAPGTIGHAQVDVRTATGYSLGVPVLWRSNHPEIVGVQPTGLRTADLFYHHAGRAVLTASAAGVSASTIMYTGPIPRAARLRVLPEHANIRQNNLVRLKAFPYDSLNRLQPSLWVQWSWSDSSSIRFRSVPAWGEVVLAAVKPGCVRVTATLDSIKATSVVKIGTLAIAREKGSRFRRGIERSRPANRPYDVTCSRTWHAEPCSTRCRHGLRHSKRCWRRVRMGRLEVH